MTMLRGRRVKYRSSNRPYMGPNQIETCRLIADGHTAEQAAVVMGVTQWTVKDNLKQARNWLWQMGYTETSNTIRLRKALRDAGFLDGVPLI